MQLVKALNGIMVCKTAIQNQSHANTFLPKTIFDLKLKHASAIVSEFH